MTAACLMTTYQPLALSFARGLGTRLWDQQGREYLDAVAGVAVTNVGHSHPRLVTAISEQAGLLLHTSNLYGIDWQQRLAQRLARLSGLDQAFFNNSGAEANETALKLARLHGWKKGIEQPLVVVMENAFHGRTLGTMAASDGPSVRLGFQRLPGDFIKVGFGDLTALDTVTREFGARIVAVLLEPIQGESGVQPAPPGYLKALRAHCSQRGWLLMLDEIQTGIGRTGTWFAFQQEGIVPDVMTLAKGLGNGIPIGACLARTSVAKLFTPGSHGSTFGGNPLACRVGCTVLDIIEEQGLLENAARQGERLLARLRVELSEHPQVLAIRGRGLMIGIELATPQRDLAERAAREQGVLLNVTRGKVIRLLPPLTLDSKEVEMIVRAIARLL
ncbi:aspartate aminotransferase family protein [Pseudomonas fluorescens]|jgi:acetylornithine/N-succinyldiaminopimelate aminotransferase|uniref:aspartate aminotransferase family protein n=1 Tax=Pseudomonas TaxID=286 RepID=UPI000EAA1313|nr:MULTISPECIES: aspartate aminotransferase family protein [Pseudomonas]AYG10857.1 aspartate aminotransferase family protein [Pseudomonas fluorescens]MBJ2251751.1 aspartate aminotransferase family protein [Pseudomonas sp. MF6784]MBU4629170.1 aspartate aminotransferase family protein [Pseudomonas sp. BF61]MCM8558741.1 aspartate aminotransferase family protein [Pseudomonas shahriarae]NMX32493.1 aspartate aminotransferase family protein [Pseudomonas sp. WS 5413]